MTPSSRAIDLVAVRQQLIEVHRAHDGANVGHHEIEQRLLKVGDLVGRAAHVEHLIERDAVDADGRVVLGDDLLARNIDDLLHHAELVADAVDVRDDEAEARGQSLVVFAEALDGIVITLRHLANPHQHRDDDERDDDEREDAHSLKHGARCPLGARTGALYVPGMLTRARAL